MTWNAWMLALLVLLYGVSVNREQGVRGRVVDTVLLVSIALAAGAKMALDLGLKP